MSLTKIGSIGINTGIQFAGVTTVSTLKVGSGVTLSSDGDGFFTGVCTATSFSGDGSNLTGLSGVSVANQSDNRVITNTGTTDALNAEANLTFDGSTLSLSGNLKLPDNTSGNANIYFGTGDDLFINHNGTDSFIINNTGDLYLRDLDGDIHIQAKDSEESVVAKADGAVELYYNNGKKLETSSTGVSITGNATISGAINTSDNQNINVGNGGDLKLYHDGSNSYILNSTNNLIIKDLTDAVYIQAPQIVFNDETTNENIARFISDGACELYHDNSKKLNTNSGGVDITGHAYFPDNNGTHFGAGEDFKIYHDGTSNIFQSNGLKNFIFRPKDTDVGLKIIGDGGVELYHDNGVRLTTTSTGITVTQPGTHSVSTFHHGGGVGGVRIAGPAAASGANLIFANNYDNSVSDEWAIQLNGSADDLTFLEGGAGGTERIRFLDTGGITFGGDTATSNALNDYEEGTITFAPVNTGVSFSSTYKGRYTKIGELVTVSGYLVVSSLTGSGNTLNVQLPFTSAANGQGYYSRGVGATFARYMNFPANYQNMVAYVGGSEAYVRFFMTRQTGGSSDWHQMTHNNITSNTAIYFNVCYTVVT